MAPPLETLWKRTLGAEDPDWDSLSVVDSYRPPGAALAPVAVPEGEDSFTGFEWLGRGGEGEVFRARQARLRRPVAVKKLRPARSSTAAFVAEALLCGRLEHPNIVPVYDLDRDADGRPFLAMKLVEGQSWKQLLDAEPTARERHLEILLQLCDAVAFAHDRGVVHNDIKPANVMLGRFGEVLLVDWGIAAELTSADDAIRPREVITSPCGTPCYMAPELARGDGAAIGPWTDTYLLGGVLFRLLTGRPPRAGGHFLALVEAAARGEHDPLDPALPEELRAICQRALAAEPAARFPSAAALAGAVRDFLRHRESHTLSSAAQDALEACRGGSSARAADTYQQLSKALAGFDHAALLWPENPAARAGRRQVHETWAGTALQRGDLGLAAAQLEELERGAEEEGKVGELRAQLAAAEAAERERVRSRRRLRRGLQASLAVLFVVLAGATLILSAQLQQIEAQLAQISAQKDTIAVQLEEIDRARGEAVREADRATRRGEIAARSFDELIRRVNTVLLGESRSVASLGLARKLLKTAEEGVAALRETDLEAGTVTRLSARAILQQGELKRTVSGDLQGALADLETGATQLSTLLERAPDDLEVRHLLGYGQVARARILRDLGRGESAESLLVVAWEIADVDMLHPTREAILALNASIDARRELALVLKDRGDLSEAAEVARAALGRAESLHEQSPSAEAAERMGLVLETLGRILSESGRIEEAYACHRRQREILGQLVDAYMSAKGMRHHAIAWVDCGDLESRLGRGETATESYRQARTLLRNLWLRAPSSHQASEDYSTLLQRLALREESQLRFDAAAALFAERLEVERTQLELDEENLTGRRDVATALHDLGALELDRGRLQEARGPLEEGVALAEDVVAADTIDLRARTVLSKLRGSLARVLVGLGEHEAGEAAMGLALEEARKVVERTPESAGRRRDLANQLASAGWVAEQRGDLEAARARLEECHALRIALRDGDPHNRRARRDVVSSAIDLARIHAARGEHAQAWEHSEQSRQTMRALSEEDPGDARLRRDLVDCLAGVALHGANAGLLEPALAAWKPLRDAYRTLEDPRAMRTRYLYALNILGDKLRDAGDPGTAQELYAEAVAELERRCEEEPNVFLAWWELTVMVARLGEAELFDGRNSEARATLLRASELFARCAEMDRQAQVVYRWSLTLQRLREATEDAHAALAVSRDELGLWRELLAALPDHPLIDEGVRRVAPQHARLCAAAGQLDEAREALASLAGFLAPRDAAGLEALRAELAGAEEWAPLRAAEDFAAWLEGLGK